MATDEKTGQGIFGYHSVGANHVGSYQVSCRPYITSSIKAPKSGSILEVSFPKVTKFVIIRNDENNLVVSGSARIAFASGGIGDRNNYFVLYPSSSFSADYRVTRLYISSDDDDVRPRLTVMAGLTNINASSLTSSWVSMEGVDTVNRGGGCGGSDLG